MFTVYLCSTDVSDYSAAGSLQTTIPAGSVVGPSSDACVNVSLVDDDILEATELFSAILRSANAQVGSTYSIDVEIEDQDGTMYCVYHSLYETMLHDYVYAAFQHTLVTTLSSCTLTRIVLLVIMYKW